MPNEDFAAIHKRALDCSIGPAAAIAQEPETTLQKWTVIEIPKGTRHLVGWARYEGRVTTAIKIYDSSTQLVRTMSGRVYQLVGEPGYDADADWVLAGWLYVNGLKREDIKDVTSEYINGKK